MVGDYIMVVNEEKLQVNKEMCNAIGDAIQKVVGNKEHIQVEWGEDRLGVIGGTCEINIRDSKGFSIYVGRSDIDYASFNFGTKIKNIGFFESNIIFGDIGWTTVDRLYGHDSTINNFKKDPTFGVNHVERYYYFENK